jgi:hypothetical protein
MVSLWYLYGIYIGATADAKTWQSLTNTGNSKFQILKAKLNILLLPRKKRCFYVVFIQKLYIFAHRKLLK